MSIWQVLAIVGAGFVIMGRQYMRSPADRERALHFLHNRTAMIVASLAFAVLAGIAVTGGEPAGLISALFVSALVAASFDAIVQRRRRA